MKKKTLFSFPSLLIFNTLFILLLFTKSEALFFSAFVLILARGIQLFITLTMINDQTEDGESIKGGVKRVLPVFIPILFLQLLPILIVVGDFYILFFRKEFWMNIPG